MANRVCENCESAYDKKLDFCPKCGMYNVELEEPDEQTQRGENITDNSKQRVDKYSTLPEAPIEEVVRTMANNIGKIKSIMVFFTWLWAISVVIVIISLIVNSL